MRSRIRTAQPADNFAQSERSGTRLLGSFASSAANLFERQPDLLREHDESDPANHGARIAPVPGVVPLRVDQPLIFVEAQR